MALKTDFVDALFEQKKIRLNENEDGTVTPVDETEYTRQGDKFGAEHINATNEAVNRLNSAPIRVTLAAAGWTGESAPYIQTVQAQGSMAEDTPLLVSQLVMGRLWTSSRLIARRIPSWLLGQVPVVREQRHSRSIRNQLRISSWD